MVKVVNILATGSLGREIDVERLSQDLEYTEYEPERFAGLTIRPPLGGVIVLFSSGKYTITGCESEDDIEKVDDFLIRVLSELDIPIKKEGPAIQNIVCTGDLCEDLQLSNLAITLGMENIEYEPEQHPFLVYRPPTKDCVMTIATTGKIVITGTKSKQRAEEAFSELVGKISSSHGN